MGKSSIVYVVGLSVIIGLTLININEATVNSVDSYATYYGRTMAHNIANAAANLGANRLLFSSSYNTSFTGAFSGGTFAVAYSDTGSSATSTRMMTVTTAFNAGGETIRDTVLGVFRFTSFTRYGWFTERENNGYVNASGANGPYYGYSDWKITGDSVFGYAHTNSKFNLGGRPYFDKRVTATNSPTLMSVGGVQNPFYNEGYEWGVTIKRDTANVNVLKTYANQGSPLASLFTGNDVGLEFQASGSVRVRIPWNTGALKDTTLALTALSANGVIGVIGGDLHVKGTYQGRATVCAFKGTSGASTNKGNVWVDGNVVANTSPRTNPTTTDMLGIVAERMSYITKDNTRTLASVVNIDAAIYCHTGEFTAEDFWLIGKHGRVSLFGSLTQNTAGSLGVFNSSGLQNGFYYSIRHDPRFLASGPPSFPFSTKYRLVAWWEK